MGSCCGRQATAAHQEYIDTLSVYDLHTLWDSTLLDYLQSKQQDERRHHMQCLTKINKKIIEKLRNEDTRVHLR